MASSLRHKWMAGVYLPPKVHHEPYQKYIRNKHHAYFDWAESALQARESENGYDANTYEDMTFGYGRYSGLQANGDCFDELDYEEGDQAKDGMPPSYKPRMYGRQLGNYVGTYSILNNRQPWEDDCMDQVQEQDGLEKPRPILDNIDEQNYRQRTTVTPPGGGYSLNEAPRSGQSSTTGSGGTSNELRNIVSEQSSCSTLSPTLQQVPQESVATKMELQVTNERLDDVVTRVDHIEDDLGSVKTSITNIEKGQEDDRQKVNDLTEEVKGYGASLEEVKKEVMELRQQVISQREEMQEELQQLQCKQGDQNEAISQLRQQMQQLKTENEALKSHADDISQLQETVKSIADTTDTVQEKLKSVDQQAGELQSLRTAYDGCIKKGSELKEAVKAVLIENPDILQEVRAMHLKDTAKENFEEAPSEDSVESRLTGLQDQFTSVSKLVGDMQGQITSAEEKIRMLEEQENGEEKEEVKNECNCYEGCVCMEEISNLKKEFASLREEVLGQKEKKNGYVVNGVQSLDQEIITKGLD